MIGAAYLTGGRDTALKVTKALGVPIFNVDTWSDFGRENLPPINKTTAMLDPISLKAVEDIIGHRILHPYLLAQALVGCFY